MATYHDRFFPWDTGQMPEQGQRWGPCWKKLIEVDKIPYWLKWWILIPFFAIGLEKMRLNRYRSIKVDKTLYEKNYNWNRWNFKILGLLISIVIFHIESYRLILTSNEFIAFYQVLMQKLELRFTIGVERDFINFNGETYGFLSTSINFFQQGYHGMPTPHLCPRITNKTLLWRVCECNSMHSWPHYLHTQNFYPKPHQILLIPKTFYNQ